MPRKPDTPCDMCGRLLWSGRTSLPAGKRRCHECRRIRPSPYTVRSVHKTYVCALPTCAREFVRYVRPDRPEIPERCCSKSCATSRRNQLRRQVRPSRLPLHSKDYRRKRAVIEGDVTIAYEKQMRAQAKRCPLCNVAFIAQRYMPASKELDHIVPINVGGTHTIGNVRIICRRCNQARPLDGSDYAGQVTLWSTQPCITTKQRHAQVRA